LTNTLHDERNSKRQARPSQKGWAFLLLVIVAAAGLRFWQLGDIPPGLYRDEATNGLDAQDVLAGRRGEQSPFYFEANNGREPAYVYLTAAFIGFLGNTVLAVRLSAAAIGTLTTWFTYKLAETWFDRRVGILSAIMWAITVWPLHLSRIGLRPILLPLVLALTFWLATLAYRRTRDGLPATRLWLLSGLVYGAGFYTYLAIRFTPLLFILLLIYLRLTNRHRGLWPGLGWALLGMAAAVAPLVALAWTQPELILGRLGQVTVLNPNVAEGSLPSVLWSQIWSALGLFLVKGDAILRHNPPGRPVFDLFMLVPFIIGLVWCARNWRRPPAATVLLWTVVMLGPTILAEDSPHFLRAVGVLPAVVMIPALGLSQLWVWSKLPSRLGPVLVAGLLAASLAATVKDYFLDFGRRQTTAYWFEAAARDLSERVNGETSGFDVFLDRRFWNSWPSVQYLLGSDPQVTFYQPDQILPDQIAQPAVIYAWPHERLDNVVAAISPPALISSQEGSLAQGDLEGEAYPLFVRYAVEEMGSWPVLANFDDTIQLRHTEVRCLGADQMQVDLYWSLEAAVDRSVISFVHVMESGDLVGQSDSIPGQGTLPSQWWRPDLILQDQHAIQLQETSDRMQQQLLIGLYDSDTRANLALIDSAGQTGGNTWSLPVNCVTIRD
jgi:4-amino-4-deoxy-L-arabinose transferase-like glycosyltransferase